MRRPLTLALVTAVLVGCGGDGDDEPSPETASPSAVVETYYAAAQDPERKCATLSQASLEQFTGYEGCVERTIPSTEEPDTITVEKELVTGDQACVRFQVRGRGKGIFVLVREDGEWKISQFANGLEPAGDARRCALPRSSDSD